MDTAANQPITVRTVIDALAGTVWKKWTTPEDITKWYFASNDWHCPKAENNLKPGGEFLFKMEAKDGSFGFDFIGIYQTIITNQLLEYTLADGRRVTVEFITDGEKTEDIETFEPENENPMELQQAGWHAILDNFKKYVEFVS